MRSSGYCTSEPHARGPRGGVSATGARHPSCYGRSLVLAAALLLLALVLPVAAETPSPLQGARTIVDHVPQGYTLMAQSSHLELHMDPQTAQFGVRDRRSGRVWLSSPDLPDPQQISENLQPRLGSLFFAYFTSGKGTAKRSEDSISRVSRIQIEPEAQGATVIYEMESITVSLALRYTLGPDYLDVGVADATLSESPDNLFVGLDLLPYLGAVPHQAQTEAYFLVPDGPGALVPVGGDHPGYRRRYSAVTYGPEVHSFGQPSEQRTPLAAYGVGHPEAQAAVLAVATVGAADSSIEALVASEPMSFSRIGFRFVYRRLTQYPIRKGVFKGYYETYRVGGDRGMRYFFLSGEEANWVGLAQRLRQHLTEDRGVPRLSGRAGQPALRLRLVMAAVKPGLFGREFVPVTTFAEAVEIVDAYRQAGMGRLDVSLVGWARGGYEAKLPKRWPPARRLGGERGLRELAEAVHAGGGRLELEDDYTLAFLRNRGFFPLSDVVIQPNLLPITDLVATAANLEVPTELRRGRFLLNPEYALRKYVQKDVPRLAMLGVDGLELRWAGELVLKDANPQNPLERSEFTEAWRRILRTIADWMGSVASQGGNDYVLGVADTVTQFPLYRSDYVFSDETVPFYPIATHGLVRLYGKGTNLDTEPETDKLRRLEYGMLPVYELTYRPPNVLARTTYPELYSSLYSDWVEPAQEEYQVAVEELGHTVAQFIVGHRTLQPEVHETRYEDGTRVIVNYGREPYESDGVRVEGLGYRVIR